MKKLFGLFSALFLVVFVLSACGSQPKLPDAPAATTSSTSQGNTLDTIKKNGKITIAVDDTFPPMEYRDDKNTLIGFDVDLANEIAKQLGVKAEFIPTAWDGILPGLDAKKYDVIMSSMNITDERKQKVDFVEYAKFGQIVVVKTGNPLKINSKDDLTGKVVGVQIGTTSETAAKEIQGVKEIKTYNTYTDAFNDMGLGRLDAIIVDESVGRYYKKTKPSSFDVVGDVFQALPVGIAVRKADSDLQKELTKAVETVKSNGAYNTVNDKWFGK